MSRNCLAAFTSLDSSYPPYTNISVEGDEVIVTVRGTPTAHPSRAGTVQCAPTVEHRMSRDDFERFLDDVNLNFSKLASALSIAPLREKLAEQGE